ncbi:ABC transporter ATP-binding protein [Marinobacterium aestuariivivens]|uniref:ATP-binding cassette domain-containing protein n=1 Tax=Marinobacterium aestuariivivens TaxID=1698799 RepID=A0ABW2A4R2_9GAMM
MDTFLRAPRRPADRRPPTAEADAVLLAASGLGLCERGQWLWRDLDLSIAEGERLALSGPSGSGKTTLLRALAGLIPITEGEIRLAGRELSDWSMPHYRSRVVYLPQRPVFGEGNVKTVLAEPFGYRVHGRRTLPGEPLHAYLQVLGRDDAFLERPVSSLSGGEEQLVALLRLLLLQPSLLLFDEPTASLDLDTRRRVEALLHGWHEEDPRRAWVWVGHDADQCNRMADRQLTLRWQR